MCGVGVAGSCLTFIPIFNENQLSGSPLYQYYIISKYGKA